MPGALHLSFACFKAKWLNMFRLKKACPQLANQGPSDAPVEGLVGRPYQLEVWLH